MTDAFSLLRENFEQKGYTLLTNEPLKNHTTFKIGGCCKLLVMPKNTAEITDILSLCREKEVPVFVLGKGSNILVSDEGFAGVVIKLTDNFSAIEVTGDCITAQAGASLASVCWAAYQHGLTGLEFAWGIPGTIGGALFMNAGAYGGEMKDVVWEASHLDDCQQPGCFSKEQLQLSYRHSAYTELGGYCITEVKLKLQSGNPAAIKAKMDDFLQRRKSKQPLEYPSAGSTFKRPEGNYASALIDQCGLKGKSCGGAQVSEKHAGFIVNKDHATCQDVLELIRQVQDTVREQTGYQLECEVRRI